MHLHLNIQYFLPVIADTQRSPIPTRMRKSKHMPVLAPQSSTTEPLSLVKIRQQWIAALELAPIPSIAAQKRIVSLLKVHHEIEHKPPLLTPRQMALLFLNLGLLRAFLGDYWLAEGSFKEALKLDEGNVVGWYGLGIARFLLGDLKNSKRAFGRCLGCLGNHESLPVKVWVAVGGWHGCGLEMEEEIREGGVWNFSKTRVVWNLKHTIHEMAWKKGGRQRPAEGKCGLNGVPVGVLFGPEFDIPLPTHHDVVMGRLKQLGMLSGNVKTFEDLQREKEKASEEELQKRRKTVSDIHPALRPKLSLLQRSRAGPSGNLYDIPESAEPLSAVPSFPVLQPQQTYSNRIGPPPELSPLRPRLRRAKTGYPTKNSSFPVPPLQENVSNNTRPPSKLPGFQQQPITVKTEKPASTLSRSPETRQTCPVLGVDLLRSFSQEELKKADTYDQASIRPESSISQQAVLTSTDPPPVPPRSHKRIDVEPSAPASTQLQIAKLEQASANHTLLQPNPFHLLKNLEKSNIGDDVQSSPISLTHSAKGDLSLNRKQALHSLQASSMAHIALPKSPSEQEPKEGESNTTSTHLEPTKQSNGLGSPYLTNQPSWWSLPEEEIDRLNKIMFENIAQLDAIAGRGRPASAYRIPPRRDSLLPPPVSATSSSFPTKAPKADPFANLLPFGFNRVSQIRDSGSSCNTTSTSLLNIYDQQDTNTSAGGPSHLNPVSAPTFSSHGQDFYTGQTSASNVISAPSEGYYESHHAYGCPTGPTYPAPSMKKLQSPLSPATTTNPTAKVVPPPFPLAKSAEESGNMKNLQIPTATSAAPTAPNTLFERPSNSISIELPDKFADGGITIYHFNFREELDDELAQLFRGNGGCFLGKNITDDLQRAYEHQSQRKTEEQRCVERVLKARIAREKEEEDREVGGLSPDGLLRPVVFDKLDHHNRVFRKSKYRQIEGESRGSSNLLQPEERKERQNEGKRLGSDDLLQPGKDIFTQVEGQGLGYVDMLQPTVSPEVPQKKTRKVKETWKIDEDGHVV